jgi:hypothetical protein
MYIGLAMCVRFSHLRFRAMTHVVARYPPLSGTLHRVTGDVIKCKVIDRQVGKRRVSLSLKQLTPDPLKQNVETILESSGAEVRFCSA